MTWNLLCWWKGHEWAWQTSGVVRCEFGVIVHQEQGPTIGVCRRCGTRRPR